MELAELFLKYGYQVIIQAFIVICLVGIVKIFTKGIVNKKVHTEKQKQVLKAVYTVLSVAFSFAVSILYCLLIVKPPVEILSTEFLNNAAAVIIVSPALYSIYENLGGRVFFVKIIELFSKLFKGKSKETDQLIDQVMDVIKGNLLITESQAENIKSGVSSVITHKKTTTDTNKSIENKTN